MYRFETISTRDNIRILARVQVHTYYWKKLIMMLLSGMILIGVSLTWVNSGQLTALLAAAGCWLCISLTYPAQYLSRSIHKKMGSCSRGFTYLFRQDGICVESSAGRNSISYDRIHKIIEAKEGFCVFLTPYSGFLLLRTHLKDQHGTEAFKGFLKARTGLTAEHEQGVFLRIMKLRLIKKNVIESGKV